MKTVISVVFLLACAVAEAQITITVNRVPHGLQELKVRNDFAKTLTAFVVSATWAREPKEVFFDSETGSAEALAPHQERQLWLMGAPLGSQEGFEQLIVTAGIFSDGTTTGDAVLLRRLILRRSSMLYAVETALEMLSDAGRRNIPREQLVGQFRRLANSLNRWYLPPEQQVGGGLYHSIMEKLIALPEGEVGAPFPPDAFVTEETGILNRRRYTLSASQPNLAEGFRAGR